MSLKEKMTALADQVRTLRNTTDTLTIDEMTTGVTETNSEVAEQTDLIAQIQTALEGKAVGGVTTPELSNPASAEEIFSGKEAINQDGNAVTGTFTIEEELTEQNDLISQISTLVAQKANPQGESYSTVYIGTSEPTSDIGADGDIYIVRS